MIKSILAFLALGAFALTSLHAEDKACCTKQASNKTGMAEKCRSDYAKLNLSPDQKTKMDALTADCAKSGCTKESMATFMKKAEGVLSKEQYATFKAECGKMKHSEKVQS